MARDYARTKQGVTSTAAIGGHPLHPALIPFPIAFLTGALATDLAYWFTADSFWARASFWLLVAGIIMGALAAVLGLIDFLTIERARAYTTGWIHAGSNVTVLVLALINLWLRWGDNQAAAILPWGLLLSGIIAGLLGIAGWTGGELAYRHKVGVIEEA